MKDKEKLKLLSVRVTCVSCKNLIKESSLLIECKINFSIAELNAEALENTPKNLRCKECNSKHHNQLSYTFFDKQIIN